MTLDTQSYRETTSGMIDRLKDGVAGDMTLAAARMTAMAAKHNVGVLCDEVGRLRAVVESQRAALAERSTQIDGFIALLRGYE